MGARDMNGVRGVNVFKTIGVAVVAGLSFVGVVWAQDDSPLCMDTDDAKFLRNYLLENGERVSVRGREQAEFWWANRQSSNGNVYCWSVHLWSETASEFEQKRTDEALPDLLGDGFETFSGSLWFDGLCKLPFVVSSPSIDFSMPVELELHVSASAFAPIDVNTGRCEFLNTARIEYSYFDAQTNTTEVGTWSVNEESFATLIRSIGAELANDLRQ
jgi:hypothetical protein